MLYIPRRVGYNLGMEKIDLMREAVARLNAAADAYYNGRGELMTDFE